MTQVPDWNPAGGAQAYQQQPLGQAYPQGVMAPAGYGMPGVQLQQVPPGMYFDQLSGLILPQGTQLASVGRRIGSYFLSGLLVFVTLGIGYLVWGAIAWTKGQTPTQQVLGMRTWKPQTRTNATWGTMFLRDVIGLIVTCIIPPFTEIVSFFLFVTGKERKALHDHIAGTIVLHDPNKVLEPVAYQAPPAYGA